MRLEELNALDDDAAARELLRCCGSARWARQMAAARPFASLSAAAAAADRVWWALGEADWREAFAAHPRIGAGTAGGADEGGTAAGAGTEGWSAHEQAGVAGASDAVARRLAAANRDYEARFGYIFIICATGRSAADMLDALERRLGNGPEPELQVAAEEQRRIAHLRLAKLLDGAAERP
jgi:2-oxo-4-hydroxy-4-carboxy-5-ureidoimidazoline decarboxylase